MSEQQSGWADVNGIKESFIESMGNLAVEIDYTLIGAYDMGDEWVRLLFVSDHYKEDEMDVIFRLHKDTFNGHTMLEVKAWEDRSIPIVAIPQVLFGVMYSMQ